jgi:hypothetical protein
MKKQAKHRRKVLLSVVALALVMAAVCVVYIAFGPKASSGQKNIEVEVVFAADDTKTWEITTDAEYLRQALEQENLVAGTESEYGLFITTVDGVTADESQQQWWCVTKGGEDVYTGVDSTAIADGDHYEITLMQGW